MIQGRPGRSVIPGSAAEQAAVRGLVTWGHDDAPRAAGPEPDPSVLVDVAIRHRLTGPLLAAIDLGEAAVAGADLDRLAEAHREALLWCLRVERRLLEVADRFEASGGVRFLVLKGPAIAHLDEADPSLRTFADLDLLVVAEDLDRAVAVLAGAGGQRPWAERRPGFDRRFAKSVTMTEPDGVEVDLHRSLADGVHGARIPRPELFRRAEPFDVGGRSLRALGLEHRVLHSAYHAVLGSPAPKPMHLRDLVGYLTHPDVDVGHVAGEAARWRGEAVLAVALDVVAEATGTDLSRWAAWRDRTRVGEREAARVRRQRAEGSSLGRAKLDLLRELSWRDRIAYATAVAVPSGEHLRSRGLRRRDLLR